jgi:hypothetical protein
LQKTLARTRSHDKEKAVLHLVVQPAYGSERTEIVSLDDPAISLEQPLQYSGSGFFL